MSLSGKILCYGACDLCLGVFDSVLAVFSHHALNSRVNLAIESCEVTFLHHGVIIKLRFVDTFHSVFKSSLNQSLLTGARQEE